MNRRAQVLKMVMTMRQFSNTSVARLQGPPRHFGPASRHGRRGEKTSKLLPCLLSSRCGRSYSSRKKGSGTFRSSACLNAARLSNGTMYSLPREYFAPHIMKQVDRLHAKGITGKGVKVAMIDGGVDFTYPALDNGCF